MGAIGTAELKGTPPRASLAPAPLLVLLGSFVSHFPRLPIGEILVLPVIDFILFSTHAHTWSPSADLRVCVIPQRIPAGSRCGAGFEVFHHELHEP